MKNINDEFRNLKNLNFREFFHLLGKIEIKVFISLISSTLIFSIFIFKVGQLYQTKGEALALCRLFSLSLELEKGAAEDKKIKYRDLYLLESEDPSPVPGKAYYEIRKYNEEGGTEIIGLIHAGKPEMKPVPIVGIPEFTKTAYAEVKFQWYGHKNNRNFTEKYVSPNTIRRYYDGGWVLEYKVDKKRKSITSSFRWIKKDD
jgi:hypothetical protein